MIIKAILLVAALALAYTAARTASSPGHLALRRIAIVGTAVAAAFAVLFPDTVTEAARLVGVGRGTDLVVYVFIVVTLVGWLGTYRRLTELDNRITQLVRTQAIADATRHQAALDALGER